MLKFVQTNFRLPSLVAKARLSGIPSLWMGGRHEAERAAVGGLAEVLLKIAGGFLFFSALRAGQPGGGEADRQSPKHSQHGQAFGRARPASIFIERGIQSLVEDSFNAPIVPTRLEQGLSLPDFWIRTGDDGPRLALGFALVHRPTLELTDLGSGHKADLRGVSVLEPKMASLLPAAIGLLAFGDLGRILRGERRGPGEVRTPFYEVFPGWL